MDKLFNMSVWKKEYNHSKIVGFYDSPLVVRAQIYLNFPVVNASSKLGSAFLRGLHPRHNQDWLGRFSISSESIRFAAHLESNQSLESLNTPSPSTTPKHHISQSVEMRAPRPTVRLNFGWGSWSPWTDCEPCSPQYTQIRYRECRLDGGNGILVNKIELCESVDSEGYFYGKSGSTESRPCQCNHGHNHNHHHRQGNSHSSSTSTTTTSTTTLKSQDAMYIDQNTEEEFQIEDNGKLNLKCYFYLVFNLVL